jgi:hypothetical protein
LSTTALAEATEVAQALVGDAVTVRRLVTGGRNSRIWRVASGGRAFALKQYPSRRDDPRDRLSTEVGALRLMERHRIDTVPRVLGVDGEHGYALLSWIDGGDVAEIGDADVDAAIVFLSAIHGLRAAPWAAEQPPAAVACRSALGGYPAQRVHPRALAAPRVGRRDWRLERRQGTAAGAWAPISRWPCREGGGLSDGSSGRAGA